MKGKEKMENKGTILSYRPDIRVVDATIRDGGLVNDFRFTDEFVKNLYQANIKAGTKRTLKFLSFLILHIKRRVFFVIIFLALFYFCVAFFYIF